VTEHEFLELAPDEAVARIRREIANAIQAIQNQHLDAALGCYVRSLGLALQLGPGPTEQVVIAVLSGAQTLVRNNEAESLSALGPALVELVAMVRQASALPPTPIMQAWATVASELAAILGQIGLATSLPTDRRAGLLDLAQARIVLLDSATNGLFDLRNWWHELDLLS
jgi:hypothetical protein